MCLPACRREAAIDGEFRRGEIVAGDFLMMRDSVNRRRPLAGGERFFPWDFPGRVWASAISHPHNLAAIFCPRE
jgi:hypothetical protein